VVGVAVVDGAGAVATDVVAPGVPPWMNGDRVPGRVRNVYVGEAPVVLDGGVVAV
jgi:hypothetical protein